MDAKPFPPALSKQHLPVLDGVRAIAVMMVIVFHLGQAEGLGLSRLANRLGVWGQTGVDLFFVLSGFLITGILLDSRGSENFLRNFYVRRALRIFPLYYAVLVAVFIVGPALHISSQIPQAQSWWFWVYLQNIPITFGAESPAIVSHFWSLAVEEHYYLVWPLLVMRFSRSRLLKLTCCAVLVSLAARIVFFKYGTFVFTPARLDGLGIGSAIAILSRNSPDGLSRLVPRVRYLFVSFAAAMIVSNLALSGGLLAIQVVKSTLIAFVYGCGIVLILEGALGNTVTRLLSSSFLGSIGKYSYGMYVLHPFVLGVVLRIIPHSVFAGLLLEMAGSYIAAWISWTVLERHFLRLKRYFKYSRSSAVPGSVSPPPVAVEPTGSRA